jgi:acetylornithine deacetylase/succinyl-diaminopimelate desuccinylase-like protein
MSAPDDFSAYAANSEPWFREQLGALVAHATISPGRGDDRAILAGARAARDLMETCGAQVRMLDTAGTPSILGRFPHPQPRAHIVIYNHFDVQPAAPEIWQQPDPFKMVTEPHPERGFLYRGRGTTDDKGPALCALRAAAYAKLHEIPISVTLLWETEEEIGSPHFEDAVTAGGDDLRCDAVIVSDTVWPSEHQPAVSRGLRGNAQALLRLRTGEKQTHSGLAGGVARNAVKELAALVPMIEAAAFWQADVVAPSAQDLADFARCGFDPDYFRRAHGLERTTTQDPGEMMLRLWTLPTFEVHGLAGGYTGPGVKTAIPSEAELKISFRLVPDQRPTRVLDELEALVARVAPDVEVIRGGTLEPYVASSAGPIADAIREAMTRAFHRAPVTVREGGSIGAVPVMARMLRVPVHFLPLSLPDHGYHAVNEYFDWRQGRGGIEAYLHLFAQLAGG